MPTALITGASRGVGAEIAKALAPTHDLILGGRGSAELDALALAFDGAVTLPVDLTDYDAVATAVETITSLDVLVHSAGVASSLESVADTPPEEWRHVLDINVVAAAELTRLLLPALRAADGHIVFLNSGAGMNVRPNWTPYAASKFALRALADGIRAEEPSLRVTSIFPGRIDTDMQRDIVAREGGDYDPAKYLRPETVAAAVAAAVTTPADAHPTEVVLRPRASRRV
ncbi:SDR family oxidoreductase [Gordonia sp. (in: high G+C Gram-positive bacteria)]|uniref:SDR family oxidoreductase n=1 Tax=Gordonia sp. (in: high G+C Gram-positive bacteria) TaxID=84139 RepID=UPI003C74827C